jgi:signal peptidase II|tara:strand:- start:48 stop:542 length:495 start_codon:yes stop_codon:yes gene_type:complete
MILKKNYYFDILILFLIFIFDRFSKIYVIYLSEKNNYSQIFSSKFLDIHLIWNEGIAFGLLSSSETYFYNLISTIIAIIIFILFLMIIRSKGLKKLLLISILGGAIGNFYDRMVYKAVPDFIDFHINDFHWFIFNIADIFISIGVFFMILYEIIDNNSEKNEKY